MPDQKNYPEFFVRCRTWKAYSWAEKLPDTIIKFFNLGQWHYSQRTPNELDTAEFRELYDTDEDFRQHFDRDSMP